MPRSPKIKHRYRLNGKRRVKFVHSRGNRKRASRASIVVEEHFTSFQILRSKSAWHPFICTCCTGPVVPQTRFSYLLSTEQSTGRDTVYYSILVPETSTSTTNLRHGQIWHINTPPHKTNHNHYLSYTHPFSITNFELCQDVYRWHR